MNKYGANVSPCKMPDEMVNASVSPFQNLMCYVNLCYWPVFKLPPSFTWHSGNTGLRLSVLYWSHLQDSCISVASSLIWTCVFLTNKFWLQCPFICSDIFYFKVDNDGMRRQDVLLRMQEKTRLSSKRYDYTSSMQSKT